MNELKFLLNSRKATLVNLVNNIESELKKGASKEYFEAVNRYKFAIKKWGDILPENYPEQKERYNKILGIVSKKAQTRSYLKNKI